MPSTSRIARGRLERASLPIVRAAEFNVTPEKMLRITPLIRERIKLLRDVLYRRRLFLR